MTRRQLNPYLGNRLLPGSRSTAAPVRPGDVERLTDQFGLPRRQHGEGDQMVTKAVLVTMIVLASPVGPRAAGTCDVPSDMTTRDKLPCVRVSTVLLEQPSLTIEQLTKGPDFAAED